jgi:hypothetical protein
VRCPNAVQTDVTNIPCSLPSSPSGSAYRIFLSVNKMGVHGLTTYLRENKRGLTSKLDLKTPASDPDVPIVVDGWS